MHTFTETGTGVPAFLAKLWRLVEDPETNHLIYWNRDGRSFIIQNQAQFARELLPMNYKHNNMASFIRQLNMYGFHKITSIENGGLKFDRDEMEFSHPCFKRGYPYLLEHIKRKIATTKTIDDKASMKPEAVSKVLNEVKVMRGRQDSLDSRFSAMKQENEALWREIAMLRQKHMKQQQIVNKLIQFLVTIVQPSSRNMTGVKRNFHLMINDVPQSSKLRKRSKSNTGPIIHELTEELLDEVAQNEEEYDLVESSPHVMSPGADSHADPNELGEDVPRPRSTLSVGSTFSDSNNIDEFLTPNPQPNVASTSRTPDPEAESIIYHITELPESAEYKEGENLLGSRATPVTHQVMVRQSNRRGRKRKHTESESSAELPEDGTKYKAAQKNRDRISQRGDTSGMKIKKEKDIDPLAFLVDQGEIDQVQVDPELMGALTGAVERGSLASGSGRSNDKQIYTNQEEFISNEMPADLFEDSPIVGDVNLESGAYNGTMDFKDSNDDRNDATGGPSSSKQTNSNEKPEFNRNLSLTKYTNEDILRFNTPREITMHLDTVQEDLETLKDLLRTDGYSLDANSLLNNATAGDRIVLHPSIDSMNLAQLFGDSDVLGPYGLSSADQQNADSKKGNELMTYQQTYYPEDLSDMLNLEEDTLPKENEYGGNKQNGTSSVLNTPMPERD